MNKNELCFVLLTQPQKSESKEILTDLGKYFIIILTKCWEDDEMVKTVDKIGGVLIVAVIAVIMSILSIDAAAATTLRGR